MLRRAETAEGNLQSFRVLLFRTDYKELGN
jgi:hypothetical protein